MLTAGSAISHNPDACQWRPILAELCTTCQNAINNPLKRPLKRHTQPNKTLTRNALLQVQLGLAKPPAWCSVRPVDAEIDFLASPASAYIIETILAGKPVGLERRFRTMSQKEIGNALV
jgi:hypothetical protein